MNDLLTLAVDAHRGLARWNQFTKVNARMSMEGTLWQAKGHLPERKDMRVEAHLQEQPLVIHDVGFDKRTVFKTKLLSASPVIDREMSNISKSEAGRSATWNAGIEADWQTGRSCGRSNWRKCKMSEKIESKNKAIVLEVFDTLFNKRDYAAAERFWSPDYIQHSAHIAPGREGLFNLIKSIPPMLKYEPGTIVAEKDLVIVHGRFSGIGQPVNWIAADIVRLKDGILIEHWDVIQDEATPEQSKSGRPMFGREFPK
jgi:predicted SnoaL-like aldol condensation-catalyzing enzyme